MPQVDKATFGPIVLWTFIIYTAGYLYLNSTVIFSFLSSLKLTNRRSEMQAITLGSGRQPTTTVASFSLISL